MTSNPEVLIVGAGGSGLTTALELAARGVGLRIVDRAAGPCTESRGTGLQARTLELLDVHGVTDDLLAAGNEILTSTMYLDQKCIMEVDFRLGPSRFTSITLPQSKTEVILRQRLSELGVQIEWSTEVTGFDQEADGATAVLRNRAGISETIRPQWLVGADGAGSTIRDQLGMAFAGGSYLERWGLMDVDLDWHLSADGVRSFRTATEEGQYVVVPMGGTRYRVQTDQMDPNDSAPPTLSDMQDKFDRYTRHDGVLSNPTWQSTFRVHRRQVAAYRDHRVFLAGDAAHVHTPAGGQGLNTGMQDGINLGWKLAHVIRNSAGEELLDTYHQERHPVAAEVLQLAETLARQPHMLGSLEPVDMARTADVVSQTAITYSGGPLARDSDRRHALRSGDRVPDFPLGARRLYEILRDRRVVVILVGPSADPALWDGRFDVDVVCQSGLESPLPLERGVVVIRPDGYLGTIVEGDLESSVPSAADYLEAVLHMSPVNNRV